MVSPSDKLSSQPSSRQCRALATALAGQCELFYFQESGFSPNPLIQYDWSRIEQVRSVEPQAHRHRVNVLGALRQDGKLVLCTQQRPTVRNVVIAFLDLLSEAPDSSHASWSSIMLPYNGNIVTLG